MTNLEVTELAFIRDIDIKRIPDNIIEPLQEKRIRPILGNDFYEALLASPNDYAAVVPYLKNILAWWVRYMITPDIYLDISTTGINQIQGKGRKMASGDQVSALMDHAMEMIRLHVTAMTQFLNDNEDDYPLYYKAANAENRITIAGGIIFEDDAKLTEDDDYTQYL